MLLSIHLRLLNIFLIIIPVILNSSDLMFNLAGGKDGTLRTRTTFLREDEYGVER